MDIVWFILQLAKTEISKDFFVLNQFHGADNNLPLDQKANCTECSAYVFGAPLPPDVLMVFFLFFFFQMKGHTLASLLLLFNEVSL